MLVVIVTDCIGSNTCKSNFQMITTTSMIKSINFIISISGTKMYIVSFNNSDNYRLTRGDLQINGRRRRACIAPLFIHTIYVQ